MPVLEKLADLRETKNDAVEAWFAHERQAHRPMLTTSVDLRHSGYKIAPVDANIYPAGFQNLSDNARIRAADRFAEALKRRVPDAKNILIFPESHTRNLPYLDNLNILEYILSEAGFEVRIGAPASYDDEPNQLTTEGGKPVTRHSLKQDGGKLITADGFVADAIVLNNDCTSGVPPLLKNIAQPVMPTPCMGWFQRKKSDHFAAYQALATSFAEAFGLDVWQLNAYFDCARGVNFKSRIGSEQLAHKTDMMVAKIQKKYDEYGISDTPYVYVKADSGTYGMGIMQVRDGSELLELNKKQRNKMHVIKEGALVHDVILQEGVPTVDMLDEQSAEPMIYMVDGVPVGGMFRVNEGRDARENLNASGMRFENMCDTDDEKREAHKVTGCDFSAYGIISAMSSLAVGVEQKNLALTKEQLSRVDCS